MVTPDLAFATLWSAWVVSWMIASVWRDRAVTRPALPREIVYRVIVAAGVLLLFGRYTPSALGTPRWRPTPAIAWLWFAVAVAGLAFTWWARIVLGRLWSSSVTRKRDHHVVDSGPYALVRHPIYTGVILATIATAAVRGTAGGWLGMAIMTVGWYVKARLEETFLRQELGIDAYDAYVRRVPMLVPFTRRAAIG